MNEAIERIVSSNDWITIILLIIISLLINNKIRYTARFQSLQSLLYSNSYINNYSKSTPLLFNTFNAIFIIIVILVFSLLLFTVANQVNLVLVQDTKSQFLLIIVGVFVFFVIRFIIGYLLAFLFEKEKEQHYITFVKISYLSNFSLFIIPLLIINFYTNSIIFSKILIITAVLLLLYYYYLQIKNNQKLVFSKMFYFILYLCALEISPFIIIYKLIIK
ncbi:MAG TPA: DUF4271 domain-containing protein [Flavobacteriia bacterium]|nr:DUF4271 domain-containing protein [Flavobacteriia bacterium]